MRNMKLLSIITLLSTLNFAGKIEVTNGSDTEFKEVRIKLLNCTLKDGKESVHVDKLSPGEERSVDTPDARIKKFLIKEVFRAKGKAIRALQAEDGTYKFTITGSYKDGYKLLFGSNSTELEIEKFSDHKK